MIKTGNSNDDVLGEKESNRADDLSLIHISVSTQERRVETQTAQPVQSNEGIRQGRFN